jgi:glycosyltransferase involved in cell wall biosynthesis
MAFLLTLRPNYDALTIPIRLIIKNKHFLMKIATELSCSAKNGLGITVLVPAFRSRFLPQLFDSLCSQTDPDFTVIVGDDASPDPIAAICDAYTHRLNLRYVRFDKNMGGNDLAGQWNRCLELCEDEWIIMPGDDDTFDIRCIAKLRESVKKTNGRFAAYHATLRGIDENNVEQYVYPPSKHDNSADRLHAVLSPHYRGMVIEYLFSRTRIMAMGGFISFPIGWFSDTATWILLANQGGTMAVPEAVANHRMSGFNLTSHNPKMARLKFLATLQFWLWLKENKNLINIPDREWAEYEYSLAWRSRHELANLSWKEFFSEFFLNPGRIAELTGQHKWLECGRCLKLRTHNSFRWS